MSSAGHLLGKVIGVFLIKLVCTGGSSVGCLLKVGLESCMKLLIFLAQLLQLLWIPRILTSATFPCLQIFVCSEIHLTDKEDDSAYQDTTGPLDHPGTLSAISFPVCVNTD